MNIKQAARAYMHEEIQMTNFDLDDLEVQIALINQTHAIEILITTPARTRMEVLVKKAMLGELTMICPNAHEWTDNRALRLAQSAYDDDVRLETYIARINRLNSSKSLEVEVSTLRMLQQKVA